MSPYGAPPGAPQAPQTLETFLSLRGPLAAPELIPLLGPVMDQLGSLHSAGQYHGNLSPETITVAPTPQGTLAAWLPPATAPAAGAWPFYLAPEQLYQGGQPGYWSDIYSLTAVVSRALTGRPPFSGASAEEVRQGHLQSAPPAVTALRPDLAPELNSAIARGLAKAPADRHASMQALRLALETAAMAAPPPAAAYAPAAPFPAAAVYAGPPPTMMQPTPMPNAASGGPKMAIVVGGAVLVMVVGSAVAFLGMRSEGTKSDSGASTSSSSAPTPADKRARPRAAKDVMRPEAMRPEPTPIALPGVDDKIKTAPPSAVAGANSTHYRLDVTGRPWQGARDAVVVLAMWSDFQCPWCKRVPPVLTDLLKKYPKDLKVVWFDFPLRSHEQAMPAAIVGRQVFRERGNRAFWRFHDKVFANSRSISAEKLILWATEAGASKQSVASTLMMSQHKTDIEKSMAYAQQIGVRGTPTLFVNGLGYKGRRTVNGFSTLIDGEIAKAQAAIGAGKTTRGQYYAYLMNTGLTRAPPKADAGRGTGKPPPRKLRTLDPKAVYRVPVFKDDVWKGAKRPLVTMVVWSDFQCPYCRFMACSLEEVVKKYHKTVRLVYRHNPLSFHKNAMPAAEAVEAARAQKGNKGFWTMYSKVFPLNRCPRRTSGVKLRDWLREAASRHPKLTRSTLNRFAKKVRLRMSTFRRHMDSHSHRERIRGQADAAKALGARGTPALFVNGRYVRGARDFGKLRIVVDEELKKARRLIKRGVSRRKLYDHIISGGAPTLVYLP